MTSSVIAVPDPSPALLERAAGVRRSAMALGQCSDGQRQVAVLAMADALEAARSEILAANGADLSAAAADGLPAALVARLKLDGPKLDGAIAGVRQVAALADPLGQRQLHCELDEGLVLERVSVPLGVLGVIFEARPDAVMQIASSPSARATGPCSRADGRPTAAAQRSSRPCARAWPTVRFRPKPSSS